MPSALAHSDRAGSEKSPSTIWGKMAAMTAAQDNLSAALAAVAQTLAAEEDLTAVINRTCQLAVATIDRCAHADIMLMAAGDVVTAPGSTDWIGTRVVSIEAQFNEGPCIDATRTGVAVLAPDLNRERRWPRFVPRCLAETPVKSMIGLPLLVGGTPIGAIDIYADEPNSFSEEDCAVGALYAAHAAIAFTAARERQQLHEALMSRDLIGQAKGIIMAQSQVGSDEAFDLLRRASQRLNEKVTIVAQRVVESAKKRVD
jgi:GAF domain-containing protein